MEKRRALASGIRSEACGEKRQAADQEKYLQISRPTKDSYLEDIRNSQNWTGRRQPRQRMSPRPEDHRRRDMADKHSSASLLVREMQTKTPH